MTSKPLSTHSVTRRVAAPIRFFTTAEVAKCLDVSTRTVRRWMESADLVAHRFGGVVRIAKRGKSTLILADDLRRWLESLPVVIPKNSP